MKNVKNFQNNKIICYWMYTIFICVLLITCIGAITRLTDSGLSITEWNLISGIIPPINIEQWEFTFKKYQEILQYKTVNFGMNLSEFKKIFWWEWTHRLFARILFLVFIIPLIFFWTTNRLNSFMKKYLIIIFLFLSLEGIIGWWMVSSGINGSNLIQVSHYRLSIHLIISCILIINILILLQKINFSYNEISFPYIKGAAKWILVIVILQIYFGALTAGLDSGKIYNNWPLMDKNFFPDKLTNLIPMWRNFFENPKTVQFIHRIISYFLLVFVSIHTLVIFRFYHNTIHMRYSACLLILILIQALIGISMLILNLPIILAVLHQLFGLFILSCSVLHWRISKEKNFYET